MAEEKVKKFDFRGAPFEVSVAAARSVRVQRALALMDRPDAGAVSRGWEAFDALFCGKLDDYMERIPGEGGEVGEFGPSVDDWNAFVSAAVEAAGAKN